MFHSQKFGFNTFGKSYYILYIFQAHKMIQLPLRYFFNNKIFQIFLLGCWSVNIQNKIIDCHSWAVHQHMGIGEANLKLTSPCYLEEPPHCTGHIRLSALHLTLILIFNFCCRTFATGGCQTNYDCLSSLFSDSGKA